MDTPLPVPCPLSLVVTSALIMQRVAGLPEPPEPQTDEALAEVGRVVLRITVGRVTAVNYLPEHEAA